MKKKKPKILFATPILQHPPMGGPYLRIENSIKALSRISDLYLYYRGSIYTPVSSIGMPFYKEYCTDIYTAPFTNNKGYERFIKLATNRLGRGVIKRNVFDESERDFKHLLSIAETLKVDLIWLGYGNISYPLLKYIKENSDYKVVLDTDSVWSRFVLRGLPYADSDDARKRIEAEGRAKEEEELWGTQLADITTAVSEVDREYYQSLVKDKRDIGKVMVFSNVIDLGEYKKRPLNKEIKRPAVYLAGSFGKGSPMEEAARWVIEKVLPRAWSEYPDLHFYIIGRDSETVLSDITDPKVTILGTVQSVLPYLCNIDVALVPLKFESGTRFKIMEAAACGIPIVSTTLGAEGIPVMHEKDILIADSPEDFAAAIINILRNKKIALKLAGNCLKLIEKKYSVEAAAKEAEEILAYLKVKGE